MSYVRMSDLAQLMVDTGGAGGGGFATQAKQATQYQMPGAQTTSGPVTQLAPVANAPVSPGRSTPVAPPSPPTSGGGGGSSGRGSQTTRGGSGGYDVYRTTWEKTRTTYTPGYTIRGGASYVEGQADPLDMFASSAVDEGPAEESSAEYLDPFESNQKKQEGPQKVFQIYDDPTLTDLGDTATGPVPVSRLPLWLSLGLVGGAAAGLTWWLCCRRDTRPI